MSMSQHEREARHAIQLGWNRNILSDPAKVHYDRLTCGAGTSEEPDGHIAAPARSSPETRARILEMFKRGNRKYSMPFEKGRLAAVSILGGDWKEYGQIVLQMAILDTLLSIEEKLSAPGDQAT
jgi:hypothetical protein